MFEDVILLWVTRWVYRRQPASINPEEGAELFVEVVLLHVGDRLRRNPQLLRVVSNLHVDETYATNDGEHKTHKDVGEWAL